MTDKDKDTKPEPKPVPAPPVKEPLAGGTQGAYSATTVSVPPEDMLTEQEKAAAAGGEGAGVGPVSASEVSTGPVETIEDQGIGPRTPYPEGNPPPAVREEVVRSQAIKGEKNEVAPGRTVKTKEPL